MQNRRPPYVSPCKLPSRPKRTRSNLCSGVSSMNPGSPGAHLGISTKNAGVGQV